jgi:hypothetical protein
VTESNPWLIVWLNPEYGERLDHILHRLSWTRGESSEISRLSTNICNWRVKIPLNEGLLIEILGSLSNSPNDAWALAFVREPGTWLANNLAQLHGHIVVDERIAAALRIPIHRDHPMGLKLRRQHLGVWRRSNFRESEPEDPVESLRQMRNVPRSRESWLESQSVDVRLPLGKSPADYAGVAYADTSDGGTDQNGIGGRHVLLFHSAMMCGRHPFVPHGDDQPPPILRSSGTLSEPDAFVFLNSAAVGVQHYSTSALPNNLVDHILNNRISVEQIVGGPHHHVRYRPDPEERY